MVNAIEQRYIQIDAANQQRPGESRGDFASRLVQQADAKRTSAGEAPRLNGIWPGAGAQQDAQVHQARIAPQVQDSVSLSSLSYEQRLEELKKLHENTDYSGMEPKEIDRLLHQRFQEAFPNRMAIWGGFYLCAGENSIYAKVAEEEIRQSAEAKNGAKLEWPSDPEERAKLKRYLYGYDEDISDEELMEKLGEKYSGGTLVDRWGMAWEMMCLGLIDGVTTHAITTQIENEMVKRTEGQYGHLFRDNPIRVNAMIGAGEGSTISWTQLVKDCFEDRRDNWTYESEELKRQILLELGEQLNQLLDRLRLSQMEFDIP